LPQQVFTAWMPFLTNIIKALKETNEYNNLVQFKHQHYRKMQQIIQTSDNAVGKIKHDDIWCE